MTSEIIPLIPAMTYSNKVFPSFYRRQVETKRSSLQSYF